MSATQINMPNFSSKLIRFFIPVMFAITLFACSKEKHLSIPVMSKILLKMHLAEGYAMVLPKDENKTLFKNEDSLLKYNAMILKEFKITKTDFDNSLQYYKKNPVLLDSIYQIVLSDIAILQANQKKK